MAVHDRIGRISESVRTARFCGSCAGRMKIPRSLYFR